MTWSEVAVLAGAALLLVLWWLWVAANRLDRLHRKVATSRATLELQLVRRASVATELAAAGLLDPVSSVLVGEAAWSALSARRDADDEAVAGSGSGVRGPVVPREGTVARELVESELSRTLRTALADPEEVAELRASPSGADLVGDLAATWYRVQLARRFHNEAVAQTQRVRRKPVVRLLRLHGHAAVPHTVEIDDGWPDGLAHPGQQG